MSGNKRLAQITSQYVPRYPVIGRLSKEPRLAGKVAVITGAARGFGQAIAIRFVEEGASVVLLDVLACDETVAMIHQIKGLNYTPNVLQYTCDISDKKTVNAVLTAAMLKHNNRLDILVNNAAKFIFKSIEEASEGDWDTTAAVNIKGHALVTKACLPYLKKDKNSLQSSSIIFLSSLAGFKGQPGNITYAATKAAIAMMSRSCAMDLAQYNIRSNSICPGILETPICAEERRVKKQTFPEFVAAKTGDVMLRRMGDARELANAALFLASAESSYITGIDLFVDGGANACTMMPMLH